MAQGLVLPNHVKAKQLPVSKGIRKIDRDKDLVLRPLRPIQVFVKCPECETGLMICKAQGPNKTFYHICNICECCYEYTRQFPFIDYEILDDGTAKTLSQEKKEEIENDTTF